jgi:asparagine synthase (glutamine-hydrolysing)
MLKNIQYFDVLRSDKSISAHGLEARVPFGDVDFVKYVMSIPPKYKMFDKEKIEKYLLRKAFDGDEHSVICKEVLWRVKEAMSDGVSRKDKSWFEMIQEYVDKIYTNEEYEEQRQKYMLNMPYDKESLFYREIFEKHYPNQGHSIPMFWRHVFSKNIDPSARLLENY